MQISDGKVGSRELLAVILFLIAMKVTDITPDIIIAQGKNASWLLSLFGSLVVLPPFFVMLRLVKKHNVGLSDLLLKLAGSWGGYLILAILCARMIGNTFVVSRSYIDIVNTLFFPLTPIPVLYTLLMLSSLMVAQRGFEAIARTAWLIFTPVMSIGILLLALTWEDANFSFLFPIAGPGFGTLLWNALTHSSIFGEVLLLAFLFPYMKSFANFRQGVLIGYAISSFMMVLFHLWYVAIFDYPAVEYISYPYQQVTRTASFGLTPAHLEALFLCIWIMAAVLHFAIYLYLIAYLFGKLFNIHEFEPLILPLAGLILFLSSFLGNVTRLSETSNWLLNGSSWLFLSLPFLLWILDMWRGRVR